jgi:hypothetical protein
LAGINPAEDAYGMDRLLFRMRPVGGLTYVRASLSTVRGSVLSEWAIKGGTLQWTVEVPPNVRAEVDVPARVGDKVVLDGKEVDRGLWKEGFYRVAVVSGRHRFVVTIE